MNVQCTRFKYKTNCPINPTFFSGFLNHLALYRFPFVDDWWARCKRTRHATVVKYHVVQRGISLCSLARNFENFHLPGLQVFGVSRGCQDGSSWTYLAFLPAINDCGFAGIFATHDTIILLLAGMGGILQSMVLEFCLFLSFRSVVWLKVSVKCTQRIFFLEISEIIFWNS